MSCRLNLLHNHLSECQACEIIFMFPASSPHKIVWLLLCWRLRAPSPRGPPPHPRPVLRRARAGSHAQTPDRISLPLIIRRGFIDVGGRSIVSWATTHPPNFHNPHRRPAQPSSPPSSSPGAFMEYVNGVNCGVADIRLALATHKLPRRRNVGVCGMRRPTRCGAAEHGMEFRGLCGDCHSWW